MERLASLLQPYQSGTLLEVHNGTGGEWGQVWGKHNNHPHVCGGNETTRVMLSGWASSSIFFFLLQRGTEWDTKAAASSPDTQGRVLCSGSCRATCPAGKSFPRKREKRRSQAPLTPDTSFEWGMHSWGMSSHTDWISLWITDLSFIIVTESKHVDSFLDAFRGLD